MSPRDLGKPESIYGISPVYLQRALIVIIISFVFFLAMLVVFSYRMQIGYFVLATAFLLIKLVTLFSFMKQRKNVLVLYENGLTFGKKSCFYKDIAQVPISPETSKKEFTITKRDGEKIVLPEYIQNIQTALKKIELKLEKV